VAIHHLLCLLFSSFKVGDAMTKDDRRFMLVKFMRYSQSEPLHPIDPPHVLQSMVSFGSLLAHLISSVCVLTALCLLLTLPVYVLKQLDAESTSKGGEYVTHTHMYNWLWTMAFVSGTTPAIILLLTGFICLTFFNAIMNRLGVNEALPPPVPNLHSSLPLLDAVTDDRGHSARIAAVGVVLFVNIAAVGTVNGLYIWSTILDLASDVRLWIQLSFALFSSLWSFALRRGLPSEIKESDYGVWLFLCLNAINSVLIPCTVTALSTPSCYQVSVSVERSCATSLLIFT
jgi:hypothetical protein